MKKIPTLFKKKYDKNGKPLELTDEFTNDRCRQALEKGTPTIKFDGSCCAIINGKFYKRYDAKKGKPIPIGAIKCQEKADEVTGHLPCWVRVREDNPSDKWFIEALDNALRIEDELLDGTYEAVGKHFNGNPYNLFYDTLIRHGEAVIKDLGRDKDSIYEYLKENNVEGIVYWLNNEPLCKIKRTDFGLDWNNKGKK